MSVLTYTLEQLLEAIKDSTNYSDVCRKIGISHYGHNHKHLKNKIQKLKIDVSHFTKEYKKHQQRTLEEYLVLDGPQISSSSLKQKLMKANILKEICAECKIGNAWNNKKLKLQLDHIDGNRNNNQLTNLRILCPNCHTQTETFCKGNKVFNSEYQEKQLLICFKCGGPRKTKYSTNCLHCSNLFGREAHIKWPSNQELEKLLWSNPTSLVAKELGVSDSAIGKRCKLLNITKPPRGHWAKQRSHNLTG